MTSTMIQYTQLSILFRAIKNMAVKLMIVVNASTKGYDAGAGNSVGAIS